jgi:hypothetical protein
MRREEVEECKEIARLIAREEIAKALTSLQKPVVAPAAAPEPEAEPAVRSHHKKP